MKHFFIINPAAGPLDVTKTVKQRLQAFEEWVTFDWETYVTSGPGDAAAATQRICRENGDKPIRIYACGGDGTLNEALTGMLGFRNAQLALFPAGSGNDFLRYYGARNDFRDIDRLIEGRPHPVDVMKLTVGRGEDVAVRYCLNVCNIGFDAWVAKNMINMKRKPIVGGDSVYTWSVLSSLLFHGKNSSRIYVDGKLFNDSEKFFFCDLCNGRYVGGGYNCAPLAKNDDGLIDIYKYRTVSYLRIAELIGAYRRGEHVDNPKFRDLLEFRQAKDVVIESEKDIPVAIDGEVLFSDYFHVEMLHHAINFVAPKGL